MFSGPRSLLVAFLGTMALQGWSFSPPASSLPPVSRYSQPRQSSIAGSVSGSTASTKETMEKLESLQALLREIKEKAPTTEGIDLSRIEKGLGDVKAMAAQAASEAEALATAAFEGATKTTGGGFLLSTANSMKSTMVTLWSMLQQFAPPLGLPFLIAASLAASAVGFTSFVRFFSLGYGASMASLGVLALAMAPKGSLTVLPLLHGLAFVVYGARLFAFLRLRELSVANRRRAMREREAAATSRGKVATWLSCALLYPLMFSPALFHIQASGAVARLGDIAAEAAAVSAAGHKAHNPLSSTAAAAAAAATSVATAAAANAAKATRMLKTDASSVGAPGGVTFFLRNKVGAAVGSGGSGSVDLLEQYRSSTFLNHPMGRSIVMVGLCVMWTGLILESIADAQKSSFKKCRIETDAVQSKNPPFSYSRARDGGNGGSSSSSSNSIGDTGASGSDSRAAEALAMTADTGALCSEGVWRYSRHANYFGEILFYLGNFIAGVPAMGMPFIPLGRAIQRRIPFFAHSRLPHALADGLLSTSSAAAAAAAAAATATSSGNAALRGVFSPSNWDGLALARWAFATLGFCGIVSIMLQATERLEALQAEKRADEPEYAEYVARTPKLWPYPRSLCSKNERN